MASLFFYTVPFIAILTVVVFVHELGHFLVGRWCGAAVDAFSVGFGPELWHRTDRHGTRWRVALLPLGGYVKFHGDGNAASVPDAQAVAEMPPEERAGALASLSVWRRAAIVAAGPIANFLLALVLLSALFHFGGKPFVHPQIFEIAKTSAAAGSDLEVGDLIVSINGKTVDAAKQVPQVIDSATTFVLRRAGTDRTVIIDPEHTTHEPGSSDRALALGVKAGVHPQIIEIMPKSAASTSDLKAGDVILSVDGHPIDAVEQLPKWVHASVSGPVSLVVSREGAVRSVQVTPHREVEHTPTGEKSTATLGIKIEPAKDNIEVRHMGPTEAIRAGSDQVWSIIATTGNTIKQLVIGRESVKQLSGPIGIAQVSGEAAQAGFAPVVYLAAILSVSIGLLNLLPIPLLDGGFLMFFAYEAIRGKALPERAQMVGFRIGLTFVAVLSIFVAFNDITKIIFPPGAQTLQQHTGSVQKEK